MTPSNDLGFVHSTTPASAAHAPWLLLLHATGGNEESMAPLGKAIAPGAAIIGPRGQVVESGMARFFRRGVDASFDSEDLAKRTECMAAFIGRARKEYAIAPGRLVAVGYSSGAILAANLAARFPGTIAGAALLRGSLPFAPGPFEPAPRAIDLERKPILVLSGENDEFVGVDQAIELADWFRAANAEVTLHWERTGHRLAQGDVLMAFDWMRRFYLPTREASER